VDLLGGNQVLGHGLASAMHFGPFFIRYFQHNVEGKKKYSRVSKDREINPQTSIE
jgi:hypothetical protein